ncbi:hypothetical protein P3L10_031640 [Capsicum annuum]
MMVSKIFSLLQFFTLFTITFASTEEATALLKWKSTFKNQNNSLLASWQPSFDACNDWYGVSCVNGRMNTLNITNASVIGTLYAFPFSSLPFLEYLDFSMNNLSGTIPPEIGNLTNLVYLDLNTDQISGTIPSQIGSLVKLQILRIFDNYLNGSIPEEIGYLRSLTKLSLGWNFLNGSIPPSLGNLNNLSYLFLYNNHLFGSIPEEIGYLRSLTELALSTNSLNGFIPASLGNLNNLYLLYLYENQLSGSIPEEIGQLRSLTELALYSNSLNGSIPPSLGNLYNLFLLYLYNNHLSGSIPEEIGYLRSLTELDLSTNSLNEIGQLRSLTELSLRTNFLNGSIPASLGNLNNLTLLNLYENHLSGSIPAEIGKMKSLLNLSLYTNNLSGLIPETIGYLTELKLLYLYDNQLSGPISSEFGNLKNLNDLELSSNQLTVLHLSRNNLKGNILQCLAQQSFRYSSNNFSFGSALKSFNLHGNKLEGKIPRSLENCQRLEVLDLGDNLLNDTSPMWLGTLPELRVLSLRLNKLHGQIRTSGSEYIFLELRILDLSCNDFSKNLPTILFQYLKAMRTTDQTSKEPRYLGDSYYHDSVMVSSKGLELELRRILTIYTTIDLSNNKFEGYIPIESLDLSGNHLVGEIPPQFASLTSLEVLNLSYNHLEGCIPQGNQFHTFENNSYEGNDRLRGFPLSKGCGNDGHDSASEKTYVGSTLDEESNSEFLNGFWKGALMGYGTGLCIGLSIIYILISTGNMKWLERIIEELGHKIMMARRRKQRRRKNSDEELNEDEEDDGCGVGKLMLFEGGEHLTLEDVLNAMGQVMEKTSYGTIYKAKLGDGGTIALRLLREGSCKDGGTYLTVIRQLGRVRHDNLIPLRAFYQGKRGEKLLIYDYLPNRNNLHELFHESRVGKPVLNWARRHKIALGIARGLAHLHGLDTPVTHGNVRSKNVLVNEFFVSRLTEFGLDKIMIPSVANDIVSVAKAEGY